MNAEECTTSSVTDNSFKRSTKYSANCGVQYIFCFYNAKTWFCTCVSHVPLYLKFKQELLILLLKSNILNGMAEFEFLPEAFRYHIPITIHYKP